MNTRKPLSPETAKTTEEFGMFTQDELAEEIRRLRKVVRRYKRVDKDNGIERGKSLAVCGVQGNLF